MNDSVYFDRSIDELPKGLPGHTICFDAPMITILLRGENERRFTAVVLPVSWEDLQIARTDFAGWVSTKDIGPLSGSWGALMDWWIADHRPSWKLFDFVDQVYLKYAVAVSSKNLKFVGGD
jgi:hypothetical protein